MPPKPGPQTDATARSLAVVASLAGRWVERVLGTNEPALTVAQYLALRAIASGGVTGTELARRAAVSGPAASQLVGALVDSGLVERRADPLDRRRYALHMTRAGVRTLRAAETRLSDELGTLLSGLPRPEIDALARVLPQLEAALAGTAPPRRPPPPGPPPPNPPSPR
jgi:DNA-binding MarR family transcriptional regulator